jgi:oxygen-independent coproporphyrinogen III oxidase
LNRGVDLREIAAGFGSPALERLRPTIVELLTDKLIDEYGDGDVIRLTARGRLLSNEVFQRFLTAEEVATVESHAK